MQAEKKAVQLPTEQKANLEAKSTLLKDIVAKVEGVKSLIPNLNSRFSIRELAFGSSDDRAISGTVDKSLAAPGTHNIEVLQMASNATALSNAFEDKDSTQVGAGYFSFQTASGEVKDIFIDEENSTLEGISRVINNAGIGIRASVVNDVSDPEAPYRLVISVEGTGTQNNVEFPDFYFANGDADFFIEREKPASNAVIRYEGQDIEVPNNEIKDLIAGVTLNVKGVTEPGRPTTLTISQDIPKTTAKVKEMVDKLNGVFTFIQNQNNLDEKSDTTKTLGGDYGIRVSEQRLRAALGQNFVFDPTRNIRSMSDLGVQFNKKGILTFDEKKLQSNLNAHYDEVVDFLAGNEIQEGIVNRLGRALDTLASPTEGVLTNQQKSEQSKIDRLQKEIERKEANSQRKLEDLKGKLARAQGAIASMQQQAAQFGNMSSGDMVSSLIGSATKL
jgi:flagellar hook-associated protein 2